ncbi:MAG: hypothetical protein PUB07_04770 [Clostridia bacterium]|nr:hypothetical protein [Clostridia bacterium]
MQVQYGIPILITLLLVCMVVLLLRAVRAPVRTYVEIIVSGDECPEDLENAVITAKLLAERYFDDACVYVRGKDNAYIDMICRRYGVCRKM